MGTGRGARPWQQWLVFLLVGLNTVFIAHWEGFFRFPGEVDEVTVLRRGALALYQHFLRQAVGQGVDKEPAVQKALAGFVGEIETAKSAHQLAEAVGHYDRILLEIAQAHQYKVQTRLLESVQRLINEGQAVGEGEIVIRSGREADGLPEVSDPHGILTAEAVQRLRQDLALVGEVQPTRIEILGGRAKLTRPQDLLAERQRLQEEIRDLQQAIEEAKAASGYTTLSGPGVMVLAYDAKEGYTWEEIVHDQNIRDLVNLLFAAGARGVEVGGQRVTALTPVRCVGPVILVNGQPVAPNPVVIKAVGSPERLTASLENMRQTFAATGKRLEVQKMALVTLVAYH